MTSRSARPDPADPAARELSVRHHRPDLQSGLPGRGRERAARCPASPIPRLSGCQSELYGESESAARTRAVRSDPRRNAVRFPRHAQHQPVRLLRHRYDQVRQLTIDAGFRDDHYNGLVSANGIQPRLGIAYLLPTRNRAARRLLPDLRNSVQREPDAVERHRRRRPGRERVRIAVQRPSSPGIRNQFNTGLQQGIGSWLVSTPTTSGSTRTTPTISACCSTPPSRFRSPGTTPSWTA